MTTTKGRIIPNDSSEAVSVLEVYVRPPLAYDFLLVAFDVGGEHPAYNTVEKKIVQGLDAGEISRMQAKGGDVTCEWESPQQNRFHLTAIGPA